MTVLNANLETSPQQAPPNSKAADTPNKGVPNQQEDKAIKPRSLAEMFGNPDDPESLEIDVEERVPDDPDAPIDSIDRLIARNKLTTEQAYAIKVPMPDGAEPLTIGQLKDKIRDVSDLEIRTAEFEERRIKQEGAILKSQTELRELLGMLPKEALKPEVLSKLRERQETTTKVEKQRTLEHIPTWRDETKRNADLALMQETLADYGFDETFLHSVVDHRAMKFIRDACLMRARIRKSLEQVRDPEGKNKRPSAKGKPPVRPDVRTPRKLMPTQDDKIRKLFQE